MHRRWSLYDQLASQCARSCAHAAAGVTENAPSLESVPRVPGIANVFKGFNAGFSYSSVHNSSIGWYSVATPALSYAFSSHYSADVSSSIYFKRKYLTYLPTDPPSHRWIDEATDAGDTLLGFHASYSPGPFVEMLTGTLSAPTGDAAAGLGTGRVNFDFTNHTEYFRRQMGLFLDLGVGNSSGLFNNMVERNYSTSGGLAHSLAGAEDWIGNRVFIESLFYEQLPFGTQTLLAETGVAGNNAAAQDGIEIGRERGQWHNHVCERPGFGEPGALQLLQSQPAAALRHGFVWIYLGSPGQEGKLHGGSGAAGSREAYYRELDRKAQGFHAGFGEQAYCSFESLSI